jgi:drug/metabolite transporter (DMT)-like permease
LVITTDSAAGAGQVGLGVAVALCSAVAYNAGYLLEKQALSALPRLQARPVSLVRTVVRSPRWLAGFLAMLVGLGLQVLALTLAPVTVVQVVLAAGVLALVVLARLVLGERLGFRDWSALMLVLAGVIAIAISAGAGARLAHTAPADRFAVVVVLVSVLAGGFGWLAVRDRCSGGRREAAGLALAAGLLYGVGALAEKAVATRLVGHGIAAGGVTSLGTVYPWVFVVATFAGMVAFQLGLQRQPASMLVPLANVVSTGCALIGASVVFGELLVPGGWWSLPRLLGFAAVLAAVAVLVAEPDDRRAPAMA